MQDWLSRTELLLRSENIRKLRGSKVAIFGIGGVGGYCAEALARSGIGIIDLFDHDRVCITNLNRQIIATRGTIGLYKVDAMRERILEINPDCAVGAYKTFYCPENANDIDLSAYDYIADAVDTMTAKIELVCRADALGVPVISSMGAANKMNATAFEAADIYETSMCPMARVMRRELRRRDIGALKVVYSKEPAIKPLAYTMDAEREGVRHRQVPASNAFVPAVAGLIMAGEIVKDLTGYGKAT